MPAADQSIASSGSFVGAVLETAGFYYQELILDVFIAPFSSSIGALIYIVGGIIALASIVGRGKFALGSWLLIGPTLFLFVVNARVETWGSAWMFGEEARNSKAVSEEVQLLLKDKGFPDDKQASVSWVFAWYTNLTSKTVREIVRVLNEGREGTDQLHLRRMEMFAAIHSGSSDSDDPGFISLLHHAYFRRCREVLEAGRNIRNPIMQGEKDKNINRYHRALDSEINLGNAEASYLAGLQAANESLFQSILVGGDAAHDAIEREIAKIAHSPAAKINLKDFGAAYPGAVSDLLGKPITCGQVWDFVRLGLLYESKKVVDSIVPGSGAGAEGEADFDAQKMIHDIGRLMGISQGKMAVSADRIEQTSEHLGNMEKLYKVVATYLFRNEVNRDLSSSFLSDFTKQFEVREVEAPGYSDIVEFDRKSLKVTESKEKSTFMTSASQMPYYQGLVLYFLSVTFPFFALLLLIPGRHSGFLMWFGFYLWAKSWDIGFAMAMMLDDVLFAMFEVAHKVDSVDYGLEDLNVGADGPALPAEAELAAYMATELDPTFQLATYYAIMGTVLHAIPVVTAHIVLGGMKAGSGLIAQGMENYSETFSEGAYSMDSGRHVTANTSDANHHARQVASKLANNYRTNGGGIGHYEGVGKGNKSYRQMTEDREANWINGTDQLARGKLYEGLVGNHKNGNDYQYSTSIGTMTLHKVGQVLDKGSSVAGDGVLGQIAKQAGQTALNSASDFADLEHLNMTAYREIAISEAMDGKYNSVKNSENNIGKNIEVGLVAGVEGEGALKKLSEESLAQMFEVIARSGESFTEIASAGIAGSDSSARSKRKPTGLGRVKKVGGSLVTAAALGTIINPKRFNFDDLSETIQEGVNDVFSKLGKTQSSVYQPIPGNPFKEKVNVVAMREEEERRAEVYEPLLEGEEEEEDPAPPPKLDRGGA